MSNKQLYRDICEKQTGMPVFAQPWWLDIVCGDWDVAIAMKGDAVKGVWPYPVEQKMGVSLIRNPKLTPYLGPTVFYPADLKESKRDGYEHETVSALLKQMPQVDVWSMAMEPGMKQAGLFKKYGMSLSVQQTFLIDLNQDAAALLTNMQETLRRNIKLAEKECEIVAAPEMAATLFDFHRQTLGRKDKEIAHSQTLLASLIEASVKHNAGTIMTARSAGQVEGLAWYVWDTDCCYYTMGAMRPGAENYKAMSLLHWQAMNAAKVRGQKTFDLEGSMDEGVERFFRNFGGKRELYMILQKNKSLPWKLKEIVLG